MPLYEYECTQAHRFEVIRPIDDRDQPIRCQKCRGIARLLMSVSSNSFGWRLTDASHERFGPRDGFERDI